MLESPNPADRAKGKQYLDRLAPVNGIAGKKKGGGKFWQGFKKVTLSGARGAFLGLIKLNFGGMASKLKIGLAGKQKSAIEKKWKQLGGSANALKKAVDKGKNKKPLLAGKKGKAAAKKAKGINEPVTATALLATAGAVMAAIAPLLKGIKLGKDDDGTSDADLLESATDAGADLTLPGDDGVSDEQHEKINSNNSTPFGIDNKMLIFGGAALALVLLNGKKR